MTIPAETHNRFDVLKVTALILCIGTGLAFFVWPDSRAIRLLGMLVILISVGLVRHSATQARRKLDKAAGVLTISEPARRVGLTAWMWAAGAFVACAASYFAMYVDQSLGGKALWPVYAFAGAAIVLIAAVVYIAGNLYRSGND